MVKCYRGPCYIHLIWNINIWKVRKCWCRNFWRLYLVKVKVTIQSFLLHFSRSVYFMIYLATFKYWCSYQFYLSSNKLHSVHPSSISAGVLILLPNFQRGLTRSQDLRGWLLGKIGVIVFEGGGRGGCSFYIKNKLKSEIFNDKKGL